MSFILNCWHCRNDFEYDPPKILADRNHPAEFYQGSTICKNCVPCMGNNNPCGHTFTSSSLAEASSTFTTLTEAVK